MVLQPTRVRQLHQPKLRRTVTPGDLAVIREGAVATARHAVIDRPLRRALFLPRMLLRAHRVKHLLPPHLLRQLRALRRRQQRPRPAQPRLVKSGRQGCDSHAKRRSTWFAELSRHLSAATLRQPQVLFAQLRERCSAATVKA